MCQPNQRFNAMESFVYGDFTQSADAADEELDDYKRQ